MTGETETLEAVVDVGSLLAHGDRRWRLGAEVGRGMSGRTFAVETSANETPLVAKVMDLREARDWKAIDLFQREAAVLEDLDHGGIPRYVDHFATDDGKHMVLVMERVPGAPLQRRIARKGAGTKVREVEAWLRRGLGILEYLHERVPPVVHRDISPNNLMVDGEDLWLIDFGGVKAALADSTRMTAIGTFGYMAPEHIMGRPAPASDLYGLGVSLLCAALRCGPEALPMDASDGSIDVARVSGLPARLVAVLTRMTRPGLAARYGSAREALADLAAPTRPPAPDARADRQAALRTALATLQSGSSHKRGVHRHARGSSGPRAGEDISEWLARSARESKAAGTVALAVSLPLLIIGGSITAVAPERMTDVGILVTIIGLITLFTGLWLRSND